jgi:small conductance mechanosensitive channel
MATPPDISAPAESLLSRLFSDPIVQTAFKFTLGLVLLLIGMRLGRALANLERRVLLRAHVDAILAGFLRNITYAACLVLLLLSALEISGFPSTTLLTLVGTAGIAIGLALKDSLSHIAAGVVLIVLRPFRVGDRVNIANQEGVVEGLYIFQTRLHAADNRDIVLMNGAVVGAPIINYSQRPKRRVEITLPLKPDADLRQALVAAREAMAKDTRIDKDPAPAVAISGITEHGVTLSVNVWGDTVQADVMRSDLLVHLHEALRQHGISLAQ